MRGARIAGGGLRKIVALAVARHMHATDLGKLPGEGVMRLISSTIRSCLPGLGVGKRWLKAQLNEHRVTIRLSDGCLDELVHDAHRVATGLLAAPGERSLSYLGQLRAELASRAEFVRRWTTTDERMEEPDAAFQQLVKIARKYALPRPWKLSEPVARDCLRSGSTYWRWASRDCTEQAAHPA
jgi:hypothetical protein